MRHRSGLSTWEAPLGLPWVPRRRETISLLLPPSLAQQSDPFLPEIMNICQAKNNHVLAFSQGTWKLQNLPSSPLFLSQRGIS